MLYFIVYTYSYCVMSPDRTTMNGYIHILMFLSILGVRFKISDNIVECRLRIIQKGPRMCYCKRDLCHSGGGNITCWKVEGNFCSIDPWFWPLLILLGSFFHTRLDLIDSLNRVWNQFVSILFSSWNNLGLNFQMFAAKSATNARFGQIFISSYC